MLEEYKQLCYQSASVVQGWEKLTKNELCRTCANNKSNPILFNAYLSAILYRYWNLIPKYYYQSVNCASPEDCYEWLVDSVHCCVNLEMWENPDSSIYKDPAGPDKVINRCMKCARLTYYQYINRKKRKDNFGLLSLEEIQELFGKGIGEPEDPSQEFDLSEYSIKSYVIEMFTKKDYFVSFLIDSIISNNVFEITKESSETVVSFNLRKLVKIMNTLEEDYAHMFSTVYNLPIEDVVKGLYYIKAIHPSNMSKKVTTALENLKHSDLVKILRGD